jgi:hypothetical protein
MILKFRAVYQFSEGWYMFCLTRDIHEEHPNLAGVIQLCFQRVLSLQGCLGPVSQISS